MKIGALRHRVSIQQLAAGSPDRTTSGAVDAAWSTLRTCRAAIEPLRGREFFAADQVQSEVKVRIRIRYFDYPTAAMRVLHGSTAYPIEAVINPNTRNMELHLMCSLGVQHA